MPYYSLQLLLYKSIKISFIKGKTMGPMLMLINPCVDQTRVRQQSEQLGISNLHSRLSDIIQNIFLKIIHNLTQAYCILLFYSIQHFKYLLFTNNNKMIRQMGITIFLLLLLSAFSFCQQFNDTFQQFSPPNITRIKTIWQSCHCGSGSNYVRIWPNNHIERSITVKTDSIYWFKFDGNVSKISWICDGMKVKSSFNVKINTSKWISLNIINKPSGNNFCNQDTGLLSFNLWKQTTQISSIPFTSNTEGYSCFKIPSMLKTNSGTLIVFSQARTPGCDDFDRTDLVYKRSTDGGRTWSSLKKLIQGNQTNGANEGECGHKLVIGNISPVQLRNSSKLHPNRILAPYTRNNFKLWITYSDDDGLTWKGNQQIPNVSLTQNHPDCTRNMSYFGFHIDQLKVKNIPSLVRFFQFICKQNNPFNIPKWRSKLKGPWQFIGVGPSQSLQLKNGRIIVPGYHSPIRGLSGVPKTIPISQLYNNFAKGFVLISDDDGDNWRLGQQWPIGEGVNEHQVVQLNDGTLLSNSRSLSTGSPQFRLQSKSLNQGQTFSASQFTKIPQPFGGCQGSTIVGKNGQIYVSSPNPKRGRSIVQYLVDRLKCQVNLNGRQNLSLWVSKDNGKSYKLNRTIDAGLSAQTSLQISDEKLLILYQQSDYAPKSVNERVEDLMIQNLKVLLPSRFVYRELKIY